MPFDHLQNSSVSRWSEPPRATLCLRVPIHHQHLHSFPSARYQLTDPCDTLMGGDHTAPPPELASLLFSQSRKLAQERRSKTDPLSNEAYQLRWRWLPRPRRKRTRRPLRHSP
jgi:hypothetical protein